MIFIGCVIMILCISLFVVYRKHQDSLKYEKPEYLENLQQAKQFLNLLDNLEDYITWVQRDNMKETYKQVGKFFNHKTQYYPNEPVIQKFNDCFQDFDTWCKNFNSNYVATTKQELERFFDNIEGKKLDDQQRTAVITDEYSNLILAGAGSGKTLTILAKVKYLNEIKKINPEDILLLSFTQKTVEELNDRLQKISLKTRATTFHKLGYDTIKKHQANIPAVTNENTLSHVIAEYFKTDIQQDKNALDAFIQYVACYMNVPEELNEDYNLGDKVDAEKGINLQTLKSKCETDNSTQKLQLNSFQGERVKSVEELTIANFLYINSIEYEYEKVYPYGDHQYRPDFYLTDYNIWLEHFGVDEYNRASWLTAHNEAEYVKDMELKRQRHNDNNTKLIETFSYYNRDKVLLEKLKDILEKEGVMLKERDTQSIFQKIIDNEQQFGNELYKLIATFINLSKSSKLNAEAISKLFKSQSNASSPFMYERQSKFLQFTLPIIAKYDQTLTQRVEIDFNDMINHAADLIRNSKTTYSYNYIIVDEYQDISQARFNLIKTIRAISSARLICVGDDWQSIYRFAGSDISLFTNFEKYVGKYEQLLIEQTYRNSQEIINISAGFVKKNPNQLIKTPKSQKVSNTNPVKIISFAETTLADVFYNQIADLVTRYDSKTILVLGRHSFDINGILTTSNHTIKYNKSSGKIQVNGFEDRDIQFLTVHKSKGTEADNVIILNLKNQLLGFPNKVSDDPILSLLLNDSENYDYAEERRLFYVALTRTKNEVVLLVPSEESVFIEELIKENKLLTWSDNGNTITNCPYCFTGKLVLRVNATKANQFVGCSHYPICNQTFSSLEILKENHLCPSCNSGFMLQRTGKFGNFLGCSNYPRCTHTIKAIHHSK